MKGTTICRSSKAGLLVAGALCIPGVALGQDPLQVAGERPRVHVVQQGETLWSIAQLYYADPLLWPEIYRLNTMVVEDPHWIYPGEELDLSGLEGMMEAPAAPVDAPLVDQPVDTAVAPEQQMVPGLIPGLVDTTQAAQADPLDAPVVEAPPPPPPPPPADVSSPTIFSRRGTAEMNIESVGGAAFRYRPIRRGEFYSAGFLTEGASIPWAQVLGQAAMPAAERTAATSSTAIYREVELRAPGGAMYQVGDSLLVADLTRDVPGWGQVVAPSGIVRVTHVDEDKVLAQLVTQFSRVVDGQVAMPIEPFNDPGDVTPRTVQDGPEARVIGVRDLHFVPGQLDIVFIDLGREDGVVMGDVFEVIRPGAVPGAPPERSAVLTIVHVRDRSASGLITHIGRPGINAGQQARLIRKMPS